MNQNHPSPKELAILAVREKEARAREAWGNDYPTYVELMANLADQHEMKYMGEYVDLITIALHLVPGYDPMEDELTAEEQEELFALFDLWRTSLGCSMELLSND